MKILNLYAGIGGNRKLWGDQHEIIAVENDPEIAKLYQYLFPKDKVIIDDAHQYLLDHFEEFDFIWSSPPCQSHSGTNHFLFGQGIRRFPDMKLYEEIIFLKYWFKGKWVVENVKPYYEPLIEYQQCGRHYFWSNFTIPKIKIETSFGTWNRNRSKISQRKAIIREAQIPELINLHGFDIEDYKIKNKRQILRNCVHPKLGLHVLNSAFKEKQMILGGVLK